MLPGSHGWVGECPNHTGISSGRKKTKNKPRNEVLIIKILSARRGVNLTYWLHSGQEECIINTSAGLDKKIPYIFTRKDL